MVTPSLGFFEAETKVHVLIIIIIFNVLSLKRSQVCYFGTMNALNVMTYKFIRSFPFQYCCCFFFSANLLYCTSTVKNEKKI